MTNLITLTIPNDDHIALRAFGKALEEMALAHGAEPRKTTIDTSEALESLQPATEEDMKRMRETCEIDTTAQQVESLAVPMGNDKEQAPSTIDSTGTPWDERIHSTSKALNADGTWRLRRKPKDMDELEWSDYVSMIKADLQYPVECGGEKEESAGGDSEKNEQNSNENNNITPAEIEPPVTPPGDDYQTDTDVVSEQTVAGIPPLPVPPPVVVAPPVPVQAALSEGIARYGDAMSELAKNDGDVQWDFPRLMTFLTERHGKIDVATVNTLLAQDGMSSVQELNAHPDKIGPFVARVKAHLGE